MPDWLVDLLSILGIVSIFGLAGWALLNDEDDVP
jgi:hypothetical protein